MSGTKLTEDVLFLACTRPAMIAGVTMEAMGLNIIATMIIFLVTGNLFFMGLGVIIHLIAKEITKHDHNKFRVLLAWLNTRGKARNTQRWGGNSISPLRLVRDYKELQ